jgi:UDPglucose--hexose-1-phosphate uridylyltransferase
MSSKLGAGVTRIDRLLSDGRTIRYYDTRDQVRASADKREKADQPGIGELRLDPLVNEWVAMAAHRQGRVFLPPKELCPLCPSTAENLTEVPEDNFEVVVFDNKSPSLHPPQGDWALPDMTGPDTDTGTAAGKCEVICFTADFTADCGKLAATDSCSSLSSALFASDSTLGHFLFK